MEIGMKKNLKSVFLAAGLLLAMASASAEINFSMFGFTLPATDGDTVEMAFSFHKNGYALVSTVVKNSGVEKARERETVRYDFEGSSHARTWTMERSVGTFLVIEYLDDGRVELYAVLSSGEEIAARGVRVL